MIQRSGMDEKENWCIAGGCTNAVQFLPVKAQGAEKDEIYERIQQSGELVVGLSADYAPYEFHAEVDGKDKIVGFDVSIAEK